MAGQKRGRTAENAPALVGGNGQNNNVQGNGPVLGIKRPAFRPF